MSSHVDRPDTPSFPSLPIINSGPERRPDSARFGALFYLGVAGLVLVLALVGWFAWGAWTLRAVWGRVYILHDPGRSEAERVQAAFDLSRDPRVAQQELWAISLRKSLPPIARYVVAEGLTAEAVRPNPRGHGLAVARSEGWPDWLRLLLARPMAYAAACGQPVDREALEELAERTDPILVLWARYTLAASRGGAPSSESILRATAVRDGPYRSLATWLVAALDAPRLAERRANLDTASLWLRTGHPEAAPLWNRWEIRGDRLVLRTTPAG